MTDLFADIRPYRDDEVENVIRRLLSDREFLGAVAMLRFGLMARWMPLLLQPLVRYFLRREVRGVTDVHGMQMVVRAYVERMIASTTSGFTESGLGRLNMDQPYLYMSNHRDIALDPAFTNYALNKAGYQTVRIAIGDNLLTKPWVSDLMRLNKSFIVKRSLGGPRELLAATRTLSRYIKQSLLEEHSPIWIAQREGRAKNGLDQTEPAIIKMLAMSRDKQQQDFQDHIGCLKIVPVAISYELDPCDGLKAAELCQLATHGSYEKADHEDVASIAEGITGNKGRVHVSFGTPLAADFSTPDEVADEVDRQIIEQYCLHPTNIYAYRMLHGENAALPDEVYVEEGDCSRREFEARIAALPSAHQPYAIAIYANAVASKLALKSGAPASC
ncbi:MAG: glycerol acyltransferase [Halieaceae bacterium]|nr:glycerol acyltransferase [Halieaceae bacterium]